MSRIRLRGLRAGNLRNLDLDLPQGRWTALHGPSGAGKTALLFGVLEPVSRRRFRLLEDPRALPAGREGWLARVAESVEGLQPVIAASGEIPRGRRGVEVGTALDLWGFLADAWRREGSRRCPECSERWRAPGREDLLAASAAWPPGARILLFSEVSGGSAAELLLAGWTRVRIEGNLVRLEEAPDPLPAETWLLLDRFRWSPEKRERLAEGLAEALRRRRPFLQIVADKLSRFSPAECCPRCGSTVPRRETGAAAGLRDAPELEVGGRSWNAWCSAPLAEWLGLPASPAHPARRRLEFLAGTRLGHLAADRTLATLSLGEARRLELVGFLSLVRRGQLALFDEPGMGLHGSERRALAALLREMVRRGNTVLTADPSREFLEAADEWVQLGPGGGPKGGRLVARGPRSRLPEEELAEPSGPGRPAAGTLVFRGLEARFLQVPELALPLGRLVAVAGVSGSGKSTLFEEELVPRLRSGTGFRGRLPDGGVAVLLERALGHAAVSTIATLSGAWSAVRAAFAGGEEARIRGLSPGDLSALRGKGACHGCGGHGCDRDGVPCAECAGLGLREDLLELRLRGRSLREWLTTPLARLEKRLPAAGRLRERVRHLVALGLGERCLGERGRRLSLGERSRIALARTLAGARRGRPKLFLLDEPCLGLPAPEARRVVALLRKLAEEGHGLWVVEHHEVLLRAADHLVELGPGAGPEGGRLLFSGPPAAVIGEDTPTGRWLRDRQRPGPPPPLPAALPPPASEALPDSWDRTGRRRLEADLLREYATRSPLVADQVSAPPAEEALPPTAWPVEPAADASLLAVLGLDGLMEESLRRHGTPACAECGGRGPWRDLAAALRGEPGPPTAVRLFSTPLHLPERTRGQQAELLRAAGFRRLVRAGRPVTLERGAEPRAGDEVWLDQLAPAAADAEGRLRDLEHHARLLGRGRVAIRGEEGRVSAYRTGACRDCGAGSPESPALLVLVLGGRSATALRAAALEETLQHLAQQPASGAPFSRALRLLRGSSLLRRPAGRPLAALGFFERRLARLTGLLLFPLPGVLLLHDQPLSGLPPALARRLGRALMARSGGAHRFTDPEGWTAAASRRRRAPRPGGPRPFSLELDLDSWSFPAPADASARLREALGLDAALRQHYLRTEEARLRGWEGTDLRRGRGGRICPACRGRGGTRLHPCLQLPCGSCRGSGWGRETAALEDRGLRWPDLGLKSLAELHEHFAGTPGLAARLEAALSLGMGPARLDAALDALPLGTRILAPLAALLGSPEPPGELRLAGAAAGLSALEAQKILSTMEGYLQTSTSLDWRDHHPALPPRSP